MSRKAIACGAGARRSVLRRAAGGVLAGELRRSREPCASRYACGGGESGIGEEPVPGGARRPGSPRPGRRGGRCERAGSGEHGRAAVRRDGAVVGGRDQRGAVRGGARLQPHPRPRPAAARASWRPWQTSTASWRASRPSAVRGRGGGGQDVSACAGDAAGIGRGGPSQRLGWPREHELLGDPGPAHAPRRHPAGTRPACTAAGGCPPADGDRRPPAADGAQDVEALPPRLPQARGHGVGAERAVRIGRFRPKASGPDRGFRAKGGQDRTLSGEPSGGAGVSAVKGGQDRTVSPETPAKTPAETPAPNARAGREPQNPRTLHPPSPPEGGSGAERVLVEETYLTERGRRRRRLVAVDLAAVRERAEGGGGSGSRCLGAGAGVPAGGGR